MNQKEPNNCAVARIVDAASWLIKAAAQLECIEDDGARDIAVSCRAYAQDLIAGRDVMASRGATIAGSAHETMIEHALLNAAGHAIYAGAIAQGNSLIRQAHAQRDIRI